LVFDPWLGIIGFLHDETPEVNLSCTRCHVWPFAWGFVTTNIRFSNILLIMCFRWQDSLGERVLSKVEGLHPTGAHVDAGKSTVICGVESGNADCVKTQWRIP
jgi:hypothetical protein